MCGCSWRDLEVFGMIFDLAVLHDRLYSVSDDRTLQAWSTSTGERLAEVYGHAARPFAVAVNAANSEQVVTAGADETLYVWKWTASTNENRLVLRKRIDLCGGATRSLCFYDGLLIAATDRGTMMAIDIGKSEPIPQPPVSQESKVLLHPTEEGLTNRRDFELRSRTTITCGLLVKDLIVLGTARGLLLLIKETTLEVIRAVKAHDEETVTCIEYFDGALHTLGRNGKHCTWVVDDRDETLKVVNSEATLEWPCEFLKSGTRFNVIGFHGSKFVIADSRTGQNLAEVECGGGHRTWQLRNNEDETFCFQFTHRGLIKSVLLNPYFMQVIQAIPAPLP
ncbi:WD repeat domain 6 protein-like protein [Aphelenchoides avenae]|nr:WD repeat domain 6 protein-like protein [Aphelenchus avenae]